MATTPINNSQLTSPLIAPKPAESAKAKAAGRTDLAAPSPAKAMSTKADSAAVNISESGKERAAAMQKAMDIARSTPDIREDRVAALKAQVDAGTYKVDSGKVADGMLREAIKDHLAETEGR